jgi:hypothetical protein
MISRYFTVSPHSSGDAVVGAGHEQYGADRAPLDILVV